VQSSVPESICAGTWKIVMAYNNWHQRVGTMLAVVNIVLADAYVARQHYAFVEATIPF
jgi:hypothetical protein